jgi:hypothetical protein
MISKRCISLLRSLPLLVFVSGAAAIAQSPVHFGGLINDYSPSTVKGGPWEMHGTWTLQLVGMSGLANFSTDLTMSDYGKTAAGAIDPTQPGQTPHVHHILLPHAAVLWMNDESEIAAAGCPTFAAPTDNKFGFQLTGQLSLLTGNGQPAPFDTSVPPASLLTVCVTGVKGEAGSVTYSNITFGAPASGHFGAQAIHGVVTSTN